MLIRRELASMSKFGDNVELLGKLPILALAQDAGEESKRDAVRKGVTDFITPPFDSVEVLTRVANLLDAHAVHQQLQRQNATLEEMVAERTAAVWDTVRELERTQKELRLAQEETIHSLSLAAEYRDDETSRHIERMSRYCGVLAAANGFDADRRETIRVAAKMHDVGKIALPEAILRKTTKLKPAEYEAMKTHAEIGYDILKGATSDLANTAAVIARSHHEKFDGTGYPRALVADEIPVEGRLAAVADVFDALMTGRAYRRAFTLPQAMRMMEARRGSHFDATILDHFFDNIDQLLTIRETLVEPQKGLP